MYLGIKIMLHSLHGSNFVIF